MNEPLKVRLDKLAALIAQAGEFDYQLSFDEACNRCPAGIQQIIWVIAREALTNIAKHADATQISIRLQCDAQVLVMIIEDDGIGFENADSAGHGLSNMRQRAEHVDGEIILQSTRGEGTIVKVLIPILRN